jgi:ABC-type multidrug transport system fused ATPase/permease subunit
MVVFVSGLYILVGLLPPYLMGLLIDDLYPNFNGALSYLFIISTIIGLLFICFLLDWLQGYLREDLINRGAGIARSSFFFHVLHKDYRFFLDHPVGDINNKVINDSSTYVKTKLMMIPTLFLNVLHLVVLFGFLFRLNTYMTMLVMLFSLLFFVAYRAINKKLRCNGLKEREGFSKLMSEANTTLTGVDTIQLYAGEDYAAEYFEKLVEIYEEDLTVLKFWHTLSKAATNTITSIMPVATIIAGIFYLALGGDITVGNILAFYYFLPRLKEPIKAITDFNIDMQNAKVVEARLEELLTTEVDESVELEHVEKIDVLEFKDLGYSYRDGREVLKGLNLKLKRGDSLAITGPSGAGKTTLLRLLKRQVTPTDGVLAVNGRNYTEIEASSYISRIAVLPQEVFIFDDTLYNNISFGKDYSEKHVRDVAKISAIDHFSMDVNALGLSGGERQRIGLARALACEFDVLILDEPTSDLDHETEFLIIENLKKIQQATDCIMIVVTHSSNVLEKLCSQELILTKINEKSRIPI